MLERLPDTSEAYCLSGLRAESHTEMEAAVLTALDVAATMGRAKDFQSARLLCARVIFQAQPLIATSPALLRATVYTLLVAEGFRLMSNVVNAVSGRAVDVTVLPDSMEPIGPPRRHDTPRSTALVVDRRWLDRLSPDDEFLQNWCEGLTSEWQPGPFPTQSSIAVYFGPN